MFGGKLYYLLNIVYQLMLKLLQLASSTLGCGCKCGCDCTDANGNVVPAHPPGYVQCSFCQCRFECLPVAENPCKSPSP